MATIDYFEKAECRRMELAAHGLSCPPSLGNVAEAVCDLDDKLNALAWTQGYTFRKDYRNRWYVCPRGDAS